MNDVNKKMAYARSQRGLKGKARKENRLPVRKKQKQIVRQMLEDKSPLIMQKVISMGLDGDTTCLKMLVDRILPAHKSVSVAQTKTDYAININVGSLEDLPNEILASEEVNDVIEAKPIDVTPEDKE